MISGFCDRTQAGRALAKALAGNYGHRDDVIVIALPRGGVSVGYEIACALDAPLDVLPVCKIGTPGQEELAMGAVAAGDALVLNREVVDVLAIEAGQLRPLIEKARRELARRTAAYRKGLGPLEVGGRVVVVADDGLATGATMRAAICALRRMGAARVVVAVPVGSAQTCRALEREQLADEVVCLLTPEPFDAVGQFYADFSPVDDAQVDRLLGAAGQRHGAGVAANSP